MDNVQSVHGLSGHCPWTLSSPPGSPGLCPGCPWSMSRLSSESMDNVYWVHGQCPLNPWHCPVWLMSLDFVHRLTGLCPECPWTLSRLSTESTVNTHWVHGQCPGSPLSPWTFYRWIGWIAITLYQIMCGKNAGKKSMDWVDIVHEFSGHWLWSRWTGKKSMDSVDNIHGLSGHCPWTERTLSMDLVDIVNGCMFQCSSRTMSMESMDFLQMC